MSLTTWSGSQRGEFLVVRGGSYCDISFIKFIARVIFCAVFFILKATQEALTWITCSTESLFTWKSLVELFTEQMVSLRLLIGVIILEVITRVYLEILLLVTFGDTISQDNAMSADAMDSSSTNTLDLELNIV